MGSHRSQPDLKKSTLNKATDVLSYGVSHMCGTLYHEVGWRIYMEDAHISLAPFGKTLGLFGVFDGHGGTKSLIIS